jgi:hypothetical protein
LIISKNKLNLQNLFLFFCLSLLSRFKFAKYSFEFAKEFTHDETIQLNRKLMLDLKIRRKIDILYNYFEVNEKILGYLLYRGPTVIMSLSKKDRDSSFSDLYYYLNNFRISYRFKKYTNCFINKYYKHFYLTTKYVDVYKNFIFIKNKINSKLNCLKFKKKILKSKLKKKKLIYFLLVTQKDFYSFYYNISINILTKKKNKMTFIRSPFIYKKSREQFIRSYVMYLFKIEKINFKNFYKITKKFELMFSKNLGGGSFLNYYVNIKYIKN